MSWLVKDADEAAAAWDAQLRGTKTSFRNHHAFQTWLQQDPEHQRAHDRLQAAIRMLRMNADLPELSALRDEARNSVEASKRRRWASVFAVAAALAIVFLLAIATPRTAPGAAILARLHGEQLYATTRDERTRIELADGSVVTLDADTRIAVRLGAARREIKLQNGRALFKVAKDPRRPFVVRAGERTITALGTLFDVSLSPRELRVTLAEGSVAVKPLASGRGTPPQILKPQQQLVAFAGATKPTLRTVDVDNALGWADRQIFFEDEPLASAIDEMNRYAGSKIVIDPSVADLRINGMFRMSNQQGFVDALKIALPVDVRRDSQGRLLVSRRAGSEGSDM
ncbi:MAG TPA: FecR domain-containing protein [Sphingomonas sp.]|jgi:transmembrane sensor|nr:FecR domain-containing protein [Sphingomonas sp.]